jgi:hypothetical protein
MPEQKIFFSYSRVDTAIAIRLATDLKNAGANVWLDQLDIALGAIWDLEVEKALVDCSCVLFIASKASVVSNNALNEVYYALEEKKRVLPIKIDDCKIPFRIQRLHYIDLSIDYEAQFESLLNSLKLELKTGMIDVSLKLAPEKENIINTTEVRDEEISWRNAEREASKVGFEHYISRFPNGRFIKAAKYAIKRIEKKDEENQKAKKEAAMWYDANNTNTISAYEYYIKKSELKRHIAEAEKSIAVINAGAKQEKENKLWQNAKETNTLSGYQSYLKFYPTGNYVTDAMDALNKLKDKEILLSKTNKSKTQKPFEKEEHNIFNGPLQYKFSKYYLIGLICIGLILFLFVIWKFNLSNNNGDSKESKLDTNVTPLDSNKFVKIIPIDTSTQTRSNDTINLQNSEDLVANKNNDLDETMINNLGTLKYNPWPGNCKLDSSSGYVNVQVKNNTLYLSGYLEVYYAGANDYSKNHYYLKGELNWSGKFDKRKTYDKGVIGYTFWNGRGVYTPSGVITDEGSDFKIYFVEISEDYLYLSTGGQSHGCLDFTFRKEIRTY